MTFTQPKYQTQQQYQLILLQPQGYLDEQHGNSLNEQLSGLAPSVPPALGNRSRPSEFY